MNRSLKSNTGLLGTALASFIISILLQYISFYSLNESGRVRRFEKAFQEKEQLLYSLFEKVEEGLDRSEDLDYFTVIQPKIEDDVRDDGFQLFIYDGDSLAFWTGNSVFPDDLDQKKDGEILFLGNNWSYKKERIEGDRRIVGLILIKNEYPYENLFLKNHFAFLMSIQSHPWY